MKNKIFKISLFALCLIILSDKVYANAYDIFFKANADTTLKNGDVVEFNAGIGCVSEEAKIAEEKFTVIFDKDIFEPLSYNDTDMFKVRSGWEMLSAGGGQGSYSIELEASSDKNYITEAIASGYCSDSTEAKLISFRLKVKTTTNQNTKVQIVDKYDYVEEIKFSIHNNSSNSNLESLKVEGYEFDNDFNKNKTEYEISVPYTVEKINIVATAEDSKAKVTGAGEKELDIGENKINIDVLAENGSKKTYIVNVIRKEADDDTTVSKIIVKDSNKEKVALAYDKKLKTYTGDVPSDITFVSFDIKCSGDDCLVDELEAEALKEGKNEFRFNIVSQNGDKEEYKIIINKETAKKSHTVLFLVIGLGIAIITSIVLLVLYLKSRSR